MSRRNNHRWSYLTNLPDIKATPAGIEQIDLSPPKELAPRPPTNAESLHKKRQAQIVEDGKNLRGIITKYNRQIGYLKKFHARSDAQARAEEMLQESPEAFQEKRKRRASQDVRRKTSESSPEAAVHRPLPPITTKHGTSRGRSMSRALEDKFQNIFSETGSGSDSPNFFLVRPSRPRLSEHLHHAPPFVLNLTSLEPGHEADETADMKSIMYARKVRNGGRRNAETSQRLTEAAYWEKRGKKYKVADESKCRKQRPTVEHLLSNPEESRQEFFEKYLRQILKRDMDPFMKAKQQEYAAKVGETPLGNGFLQRMGNDIKDRKQHLDVSAGE